MLTLDSVFDRLLFADGVEVPYPDDAPLISSTRIERELDRIEEPLADAQLAILEQQTDAILEGAIPFVEAQDVAGLAQLTWTANIALQMPIYDVWQQGYRLGAEHLKAEVRAAISASERSQFALDPGTAGLLNQFLSQEPLELQASAVDAAVQARAIQLAGNFSRDQLSTLRQDLIAAVIPQANTGNPISRRELLERIEKNLNVGKARANAIARTELTHAYNVGRVEMAKTSVLVEAFRFLAITDTRTTDICRSRNGLIIPVAEAELLAANRPPLHTNCRSVLSPAIPRVNRRHREWMNDPGRRVANRELVALPEGWVQPGATPSAPVDRFPVDVDGLETIRELGGSTGAQLVRDPLTGNQFVLKRGSSPEHLREEFAADQAYRALGVRVPEPRLYETTDGPIKLAEFIEGTPLAELADDARQGAIAKIQQDFAADALLGNWDVVGLSQDNILVDAAGNPWRIDNGGSLRYRAQGALKGDAWGGHPVELWTLRDNTINPQSAQVFGDLSISQIGGQIDGVLARQSALLGAIPDELQDDVIARLNELRETREIAQVFAADKFKDSYTDGFLRQRMGIRAAGISDRMPRQLIQARQSVIVVDENGKDFDDLRGENSLIGDLANYIEGVGGDYGFIESWAKQQAGNSWNTRPQAMKYYLSQQRDVSDRNYFWRDGESKAASFLDETSTKISFLAKNETSFSSFEDTIQAYHAFNYELLRNTQITNSDRATQTIRLMRTENRDVMQDLNGFEPGQTGLTMQRGVL